MTKQTHTRRFLVELWARFSGLWRGGLPTHVPAALTVLAVALFVFENRRVHAPIDDAYIFYRYAQNLVHGHGLVYNEGERVEGVTSLLWTLLVAAGVSVGGNPVAVGHWLGVVSGSALLWLTYAYASFGLNAKERLVAALAPWLLFLSLPFAVWSASGLETPLFAAIVILALILESRGRPGLAVLVSMAAVLTRPEGAALGAIILGMVFWKKSLRINRALGLVASYLAFLALLTAFRLFYYRAPLPNTFYAKVGGASSWWGVYYVLTFLLQTLLPLLWPSAYAFRQRCATTGLLWSGAVLAMVLAEGGDAFHFSRFFVPVLPVLCSLAVRGALRARSEKTASARFAVLGIGVSAAWFALGNVPGLAAAVVAALEAWSRGRGRWRRALFAVASIPLLGAAALAIRFDEVAKTRVAAFNALEVRVAISPRLVMRWMWVSTRWAELNVDRRGWAFFARFGQQLADEIDARPPEYKVVAVLGIGAFGYFSKARVLDIVGLVDPIVARTRQAPDAGHDVAFPGHQRTNARYVLARHPDYILIPERGTASLRLPAVAELWNDPDLDRFYEFDESIGGYRRVRLGDP